MSEQAIQLERVQSSIGGLVEAFINERWTTGARTFFMRELHDYIFQNTQIAPASPDRILRQLRLNGQCDYKVLNRRASHYEITSYGASVTS